MLCLVTGLQQTIGYGRKVGGEKKVLCTLDTSSAWDMDINQMDGISIPDAQDYRNM